MGLTVYYPNSANCTAWAGYDSGLPPDTLVMDTEVECSGSDLDDASAADNIRVVASQAGAVYSGVRVRFKIVQDEDLISMFKLTVEGYGQETSTPGNGFNFYVWRGAPWSSWELCDSHEDNRDKKLVKNVRADEYLIEYIDASGYLYVLVQALGGIAEGTSICRLDWAKCEVFAPPSGVYYDWRRRRAT